MADESGSILHELENFLVEAQPQSEPSPQPAKEEATSPAPVFDAKPEDTSEKNTRFVAPPKPLRQEVYEALDRIHGAQQKKIETIKKNRDFDRIRNRFGFLVFNVARQRFALPMTEVLASGKLEHKWWLQQKIPFEGDLVPLRDLKRLTGTAGPSGTAYLIVKVQGKKIAWSIDGIEIYSGYQECKIRPLKKSRSQLGQVKSDAILVNENTSFPQSVESPIYLINSDQLRR